MSLIFGAIAGGLAGAGAAGEKAFARMHEHENQKSLEQMRADLMFEKESRLIELRHGNEVKMKRDIEQPFLAGQNKLSLESAERQRREADVAAGERVGMQTASAEKINTANLASHAKDRESREKVANISAWAAMHEKPVLRENADGTVSFLDPKTAKATLVVDSKTGQPTQVKIPITKETELYVNTLSGFANRIMGNSASSPEERARARNILDVQIPAILSRQKPIPDNVAMAAMKKALDNPQARLGWEKIYGVGTIEPAMAAFDAAAAAAKAAKDKVPGPPGPTPTEVKPDRTGPPPPVPANTPPSVLAAAARGEAAAAKRREAAVAAKEAAKVQAEQKAAATEDRKAAVRWLSADAIDGMTQKQAFEYKKKYWDVMTKEQRDAVRRKTAQGLLEKVMAPSIDSE